MRILLQKKLLLTKLNTSGYVLEKETFAFANKPINQIKSIKLLTDDPLFLCS